MTKPKEVSLESPPKTEIPKVELPKDENNLFDEDVENGTSTVHDSFIASEEEETPLNNVWDHAIDTVFKLSTVHPDGKGFTRELNIKPWTPWNNFSNGMKVNWYNRGASHTLSRGTWEKTTLGYLITSSYHEECADVMEIHPPPSYGGIICRRGWISHSTQENFHKITWKEFMTSRLNNSTLSHCNISPVGYRGPPKPDSIHNAQHLMNFRKCIKREVSQYRILKDEKYFEAFIRTLLVTATTHSCEEVLDVHYMPGHDEDSQELFQQKQYFKFSV